MLITSKELANIHFDLQNLAKIGVKYVAISIKNAHVKKNNLD